MLRFFGNIEYYNVNEKIDYYKLWIHWQKNHYFKILNGQFLDKFASVENPTYLSQLK